MKISQKWIYILSGLAGIFIIVGIFLHVGAGEILANIAKIGFTGFIVFFLNGFLVLVVGTIAWVILLGSMGFKAPFPDLVMAKMVGFSISFLTPSMNVGGEPARTYFLHKKCNLPGSATFSTVLIDKFLELVGFFVFLFVGSLVAIFKYDLAAGVDVIMIVGSSFLGVVLILAFLTFLYGMKPFSRIMLLFSPKRRIGRMIRRKIGRAHV